MQPQGRGSRDFNDREGTNLVAKPSRVNFWMNTPSLHQAPLISALRLTGVPVRVISEFSVADERIAQGWSLPRFDADEVHIAPSRRERAGIEHSVRPDELNVFFGVGAYPATTESLVRVTGDATNIVFSEPWDPRGLAAFLRALRYRRRILMIGPLIDGMLLTGSLACEQFASAGYPREQIFPFGYFVDTIDAEISGTPRSNSSIVRIAMVAQLVPRKGVLEFLEAFAISDARASLDLFGGGVLESRVRRLVRNLGIDSRVTVHGPLPNSVIRRSIEAADVLFLNSKFDGWGAVVNEALTVGTRVAVTGKCGASQIANAAPHCVVYSGDSKDNVATAIKTSVDIVLETDARESIRAWAREAISPQAAAEYLLSVYGYLRDPEKERPAEPWRLR